MSENQARQPAPKGEVKRYDMQMTGRPYMESTAMVEDENGDFVRASSYASLSEELSRVKEERDVLVARFRANQKLDANEGSERDALREALEKIRADRYALQGHCDTTRFIDDVLSSAEGKNG